MSTKQVPTVEEKFIQKLATPFYRERVTIKGGPFSKLRSKIDKCANRSEDPDGFRSSVYRRLFLILHHAETSSAITSIIATQAHIRDLASRTLDFLEYFYTLDCRRSITGMQAGCGMPTQEMVQKIRASNSSQ